MIDPDLLREHYEALHDDELRRLAREGQLIPKARAILEAELRARGIVMADAPSEAAPAVEGQRRSRADPYRPPRAVVADRLEPAGLTVAGLLRVFQTLVIAATVISLLLAFWPYLPIPLSERTAAILEYGGAGSIAPGVSRVVFFVAQPLWILSAIGLCFLRWWGRVLFVGTHVVTSLSALLGGVYIVLPWESFLGGAVGLMDGAILTLAFLPPLSRYFAREPALRD